LKKYKVKSKINKWKGDAQDQPRIPIILLDP